MCLFVYLLVSHTDCIPYKLDDLVRPYVHKVCLLFVCVFVCGFVRLFAGQSVTAYLINWTTSSDLMYTRCDCCCLFVGVCWCICLFVCLFVVCRFVYLLVEVTDRILYKLDDLVRPYVHKMCLFLFVCGCVCLLFVGLFVVCGFVSFAGQSLTAYFIYWTTSSDLTYTRCLLLFVCGCVCLFVGVCLLFVDLFVVCVFVSFAHLLVKVIDLILYYLDHFVGLRAQDVFVCL